MGRTFFTADTHFGHQGIIGMCDRPFGSIREHDDCIIAAWNDVVTPSDTVYHLGDFAYRTDDKHVRRCFDALNGTKHLILGNHDFRHGKKPSVTLELPWASQNQLTEVNIDGQEIVLCHYALRSWRKMRRGTLHFFGHSHGNMPGTAQCIDVGVDVFNYQPVTLQQIKSRLAQLPTLVFRDDTDAVAQLEKPESESGGYGR